MQVWFCTMLYCVWIRDNVLNSENALSVGQKQLDLEGAI